MNPLLLLLSLAAAQPDPALLAGLEYRQLPLTRGGAAEHSAAPFRDFLVKRAGSR